MLNHIALGARDPERLAEFYEKVLGLRRLHLARDDRGVRAIWYDLGSERVLMIERSGDGAGLSADNSQFSPPPAGLCLLAFTIERERLSDYEERLAAAGLQITHRSDYTIYFRDPEGNRVGLSWFNPAEFLS